MKKLTIAISALCLLALSATGQAQTKAERKVLNATEVIQQFTQMPEKKIPPGLLNSAYGIAIIPDTMKIGFGIGGRRGKGVLMVRRPDGSWSNPSFVTLTGGSFGWQIGAQATDIVLVFRSRKSIDNIARTKVTLGGDASVAAGPIGRQTSAATDEVFKAEIYSYSRNRGLFAGVALDGSVMTMDERTNLEFYRNGNGTAEDVLMSSTMQAPPLARDLINTMNSAAPRQAMAKIGKTQTASASSGSGARTYGVDDQAGVNY